MSKAARTNLILFLICIFLFLIAWFQPGLHKQKIEYFTDLKKHDIDSIVIERKGLEKIKLIKKDNSWLLEEPEKARANILRVDTILALAEKRSYLKFQVSNEELERYQLKLPKVSVWLNNNHYVIGGKHPVKNQRYAMQIKNNSHSDINTVHLIEANIFYQLRSNLNTFIFQKK